MNAVGYYCADAEGVVGADAGEEGGGVGWFEAEGAWIVSLWEGVWGVEWWLYSPRKKVLLP